MFWNCIESNTLQLFAPDSVLQKYFLFKISMVQAAFVEMQGFMNLRMECIGKVNCA